MSEESITRVSLQELIHRKGKGRTDWERLRREEEQGIEPEPDPDEGEFDWSRARVVMPASKTGVYMRLDDDVIAFFKEAGRGYQVRINAVLRSYMEAHRPAANATVAAQRPSRGVKPAVKRGRAPGRKRKAG